MSGAWLRTLFVEMLKCRRSMALRLAVGTPLFLSVVMWIDYANRPGIEESRMWDWAFYFQTLRALWGVFGFALLLALLAAFLV